MVTVIQFIAGSLSAMPVTSFTGTHMNKAGAGPKYK